MSDAALTTPKDNVANTATLTDAQVGNAVATKFLNEINTALTGPKDTLPTEVAAVSASSDLGNLVGDPQQKAVINAIAEKVTDHDPSLGIVQGTVERGPNGDITGFSFTNPQSAAAYNDSLNAYMLQGHTRQEAIANDGSDIYDQYSVRGQIEMPVVGNPPPSLPQPPAGEGNSTGISVNGQW